MNTEKLEYLIKLQEANLQITVENKAILIQNNILLKEILTKLDDPANDAKALAIDLLSNLAAYNVLTDKKE